jgi:hypothetical protein
MAVRARVALANVLRARGRGRDAEALLLATYAEVAAARGVASPRAQEALRALVALYTAAGRAPEAARYRALLVTRR